MPKIYRAQITFDIYPEENELLNMLQDDGREMTEEELIKFAREELCEAIYNGLKYNEIYDLIDVEVLDA